MKCPSCKETNLVMSERKGIEIDYCPECRGIWLDRGELDKILERSREDEPKARQEPEYRQPQSPPQPQPGYYQPDYNKHYYKKKKSFLEELFD
jgi:uncharacterized protein